MFSAITKKSVIVKALSKVRLTVLAELLTEGAKTADGEHALRALAKRLTDTIVTITPKDKEQLDSAAEIVALCSLVTTDDNLLAMSWMCADYSKIALAVCLAVVADTEQGARALRDKTKDKSPESPICELADAVAIALGKSWIHAPDSPDDWLPL